LLREYAYDAEVEQDRNIAQCRLPKFVDRLDEVRFINESTRNGGVSTPTLVSFLEDLARKMSKTCGEDELFANGSGGCYVSYVDMSLMPYPGARLTDARRILPKWGIFPTAPDAERTAAISMPAETDTGHFRPPPHRS
jgi:hypothetical protein